MALENANKKKEKNGDQDQRAFDSTCFLSPELKIDKENN
jgi:hypothetical protein